MNYFLSINIEDNSDLGRFLKEKLYEALGEKFTDIEQIIRLMKSYTNSEKIQKYRNPPAHAMYLKYETAVECREMVLNLFIDNIIPLIKS